MTVSQPRLAWRRPDRPYSARWKLTAALVAATVWAVVVTYPTETIVHASGASALARILAAAFHPDLNPRFLATASADALTTVAYAVLGMVVAVLIGVPGAVLASGALARRATWRRLTAGATRALLGMLRSIHELVWGLLFINAWGLTPWAGVLAIGLAYGGIVGRNLAEQLQDVPQGPLHALRTAGAGRWQELLWGRAPMTAADSVGYVVYRFECAVRSAAVLSFVGLGGIGFRIQVALADLRFTQVWTLVYILVVIIVITDHLGRRMRRRVTG